MGDPYCLGFDEKGYTPTYEKFEPDQVVKRVAKLISDQDLLEYAEKFKDKLSDYADFKGKFYTYDPKTKKLKLESEWRELENKAESFLSKHGNSFTAVLEACWEANIMLGKKWDNWWMIYSIAKERGLIKSWLQIIADLERIGLIERHKGNIWIPEERILLVKTILEKHKTRASSSQGS